jgi:hypothetical protein
VIGPEEALTRVLQLQSDWMGLAMLAPDPAVRVALEHCADDLTSLAEALADEIQTEGGPPGKAPS